MTRFAYLDKGAILHIVENKSTAKEFARKNGKVVETEVAADKGYPIAGGSAIICYSPILMKRGGDDKECLNPLDYQEIAALYRECE